MERPLAQLVYDGGHDLTIPSDCGTPSPGQMQGTIAERLAELAGRECYDSLGRGRDSAAYHMHILEVGHLSVLEHYNFTIGVGAADVDEFPDTIAAQFLNRPGCFVRPGIGGQVRVTLNLRCVLDWNKWSTWDSDSHRQWVEDFVVNAAACQVPQLMTLHKDLLEYVPLEPEHDEERWVTLRLVGSRGFSHELVRHGDRTAISQRSTRYVDEADSPWCHHPILRRRLAEECHTLPDPWLDGFVRECQWRYREVVGELEPWLIAKGVEKGTARKQARGAARGFLGNALQTSLIFSASVAQWRRMLKLRAHPAADAEIRAVFCQALACLKESRYGDRFADLNLKPSPDGIGEVLDLVVPG